MFSFFFLESSLLFSSLSRGFTLSGFLLDEPWSQVSSLFPPGTCLHLFIAPGAAFPLLVDFHRIYQVATINSRFRASRFFFFREKKSLRVCIQSVRLEATKRILVDTRATTCHRGRLVDPICR